MQKLFDNMLAARMKVVFENHQEIYNPADWENMRAKLGKKPGGKKIYLYSYLAKAASVALFMGLSVFYVNQNFDRVNENRPSNYSFIQANDSNLVKNYQNTNNSNYQFENQNIPDTSNTKQNQITPHDNDYHVTEENKIANNEKEIEPKENSLLIPDSSKNILANIRNILENYHNHIQEMTNNKVHDSTNANMVAKNIRELDDEEVEKKKAFEFGVELASVSNYGAETKGSSLNVGGGFSAAYRVSKNISLATGMVISKQNLAYNASPNVYQSLKTNDYLADNSLSMVDANTVESNLSFVSIDVPMNLKFRHKKFVVSAGVSSLLFLSEKYSYNYDAMVNTVRYNTASASYESINSVKNITQGQTNESFNHFDFAGLFNFSVAYDLPLAKGSLAFEPYVKLPLTGISSQDIKIGSGGIALRYNF